MSTIAAPSSTTPTPTLTSQQQADHDDLASAVGAAAAAAHELGLSDHHFHHQLQAPVFNNQDVGGVGDGSKGDHNGVDDGMGGDHHHDHDHDHMSLDVSGLDIPTMEEDDDDDDIHGGNLHLDLDLSGHMGQSKLSQLGRPPSIRKACDLCHAAKQKCSGDRPSCTRCTAGGWECHYAPRQRRRTVPKEQRLHHLDITRNMTSPLPAKKRKLNRESVSYTPHQETAEMTKAMSFVDLGLPTAEEEGEEMTSMTDEQMLESIAIDGYLADLPLATFQHNLPYIPPPPVPEPTFNPDDFSPEMDPHTTSALRDAIFSLNESHTGPTDGVGDAGDQGDIITQNDPDQMDPHLALLDLSHAMPEGPEGEGVPETQDDLGIPNNGMNVGIPNCQHPPLVPHILNLLTQHSLDPKHGCNTPLTLGVFTPLARSLRLFHSLIHCTSCMSNAHQTLAQLALLSRTTTILTYPFPPLNSSSYPHTAQITLQGARLTGTGLSEAIETHIVGVVWDSWRAAIREIFASIERKAQDVITQSAAMVTNGGNKNSNSGGVNGNTNGGSGGDGSGSGEGGGEEQTPQISFTETQRAGLLFQAMSRLVTAMDEVEGA